MRNILSYKLYEGVYSDTITEISKKKKEIDALKSNYLEEVGNCLVDITDIWSVEYYGYPRDIEGDTDYGEFEICCEVLVKMCDINNFLDKFDDVYHLISSYIGDVDIAIESIWCSMMSNTNFNDYFKEITNSSLEKKKEIISNFLSKSGVSSDDELLSICIVVDCVWWSSFH